MIYTFNAQDFVMYPIMRTSLDLSDSEVYQTVQQ